MGFLLHDVAGIARAAMVLPLLLALPGFAIAWTADIAGFRSRRDGAKWAWAVVLSFAVVPEVLYLGERFGGFRLALGCVLLLDVYALICVVRTRSYRLPWMRLAVGFMALVIVVAALLVDFPWHGGLYVSSVVLDQAYRVAFVRSLAMHGLPAVNPLNYPGAVQPLRYYYFWYLVCAVPVRLLGLDARCVLIASSAWSLVGADCALGLLAWRVSAKARVVRVALALMAVTGLDVLVVAANHWIGGEPLDIDMEWWSRDQVSSWADSVLWVPHHLGALAVALGVLLILWRGEGVDWRKAVVAGVAMASCFGLSAYVGLALVIVVSAWALIRWVRGDRPWIVVAAMLAALIFVMPMLREMSAGMGHGGLPLKLGIREMIASDVFGAPTGSHAAVVSGMLKFAFLPLGYFVELGFFLIAWIHAARRWRRLGGERRELLALSGIAFVVCTFLRSTAIHNNDFGYRSALILQALLLVIAAVVVVEWSDAGRRWTVLSVCACAAVLAGVAGTMYQAVWLRMYAVGNRERAVTARDMRMAYSGLSPALNAVAQWGPPVGEDAKDQRDRVEHTLHLLYSPMQVAATDADCGAPFGGDGSQCVELQRDVTLLSEGISADEARRVCDRWGITYLVATADDAAWRERRSWVWTLPEASVASKARVLRCQTKLQ